MKQSNHQNTYILDPIEGLYFHTLEKSEVTRGFFPKYRPLLFGIAENTNHIRPTHEYGTLYVKINKINNKYYFNLGYNHCGISQILKIHNAPSYLRRKKLRDAFDYTYKNNISILTGTTSICDGEYREDFEVELTFLPEYFPNPILWVTNLTKNLSCRAELLKVSSRKTASKVIVS